MHQRGLDQTRDFNLADLILEIVTRRATKQKVSTVALAQKRAAIDVVANRI